MTESNEHGFSDPLFVLLGSLLGGISMGVTWWCRNHCRDQSLDCNSGCCRFHSSTRMRETIRQEVRAELESHHGQDSERLDVVRKTDEDVKITVRDTD